MALFSANTVSPNRAAGVFTPPRSKPDWQRHAEGYIGAVIGYAKGAGEVQEHVPGQQNASRQLDLPERCAGTANVCAIDLHLILVGKIQSGAEADIRRHRQAGAHAETDPVAAVHIRTRDRFVDVVGVGKVAEEGDRIDSLDRGQPRGNLMEAGAQWHVVIADIIAGWRGVAQAGDQRWSTAFL